MFSEISNIFRARPLNIFGRRMSLLEQAFVFLFPLLYMQMYDYIEIPEVVRRLSVYGVVFLSILYTLDYTLLRRYKLGSIPSLVKAVLGIIVISSLMSLLSRGQSLILSYRVMNSFFLGYIYFFVLYKIKPDPKVLLKVVFVYSSLYALCFVWGIINAPTMVFDTRDDYILEDSSRGAFRLFLKGLSMVILLFFYSVVRGAKRWQWYIVAGISYIFIFLSLTRQIIFLTLFVAGLYLVWKKLWLRIVVIVMGIFILTMQSVDLGSVDDSTVFGSLVNVTINEIDNHGTENIRIRAAKAFFLEHPQNAFEVVFGSGYYHVDSNYGAWEIQNFWNKGYIRSDVGYAGTYVTFGLLGLFVFLALFTKAISIKGTKEINFIKLFVCYTLLGNIAMWQFRGGCVETSICLYLLAVYRVTKTSGTELREGDEDAPQIETNNNKL